MSGTSIWIHIVLFIILGIGFCCFVAAFAESIRMMFMGFMNVFYRPLFIIQERTTLWLSTVKTWLLKQLEDESERKGDGPIYYIIGSVIYSILTVCFIMCDFGMIVMTAEAMGLDEASVQLPIDTATLTAATLVTTSLFWGALFFDLLGVTRLAPWKKSLTAGFRRTFMVLSVLFFTISLFVGVSMAYWRAYMTTDFASDDETSVTAGLNDDLGGLVVSQASSMEVNDIQMNPAMVEEPSTGERSTNWVIYACLIGISGLSISATAFSVVGLIILLKFIILILIFLGILPLLPVAFAAWLLSTILNLAFNAIERTVDFFIQVGSSILRRFGWQPSPSEHHSDGESSTNDDNIENNNSKIEHDHPGPSQPDPGFNPFPAR